MNDTTVLITGVSGFIAKHCAVELLNAGYRVRGTIRSLDRSAQVKDTLGRHADTSRLEFAETDLESDAGWSDGLNTRSDFSANAAKVMPNGKYA